MYLVSSMKTRSLNGAVSLVAAFVTAAAPLLSAAQTAYEFKTFKKGLVVSGAATPETPATPPGPTPQPVLQLSTNAVNFGEVATHTTETRQVLVSNTGTGSLSFTAVPAATGDAAFAAGLTTCGATLAAGADCLADATFSPTTVGTYNGVLRFTSVLANSPHDVTLVGTAFNPVSLAGTTLPKAMVGQAYSFDFKSLLSVSNEASPDKSLTTWSSSGTLPSGLSFNLTTGVLSGTPSVPTEGVEYTLIGTYKNNQGQQVYTIKVGDAVLQATQIATGTNHTCAVTADAGVKCWGANNYGQLGNGTTVASPVPVAVSGLQSGVLSVSVGFGHSCAVTQAGAALCWGYNSGGQIGDGSGSNRYAPVAVSGLGSGVASITTGNAHSCAVHNGAAKCWGANTFGLLGDGTTTNRSAPVAVSGLSVGVSSISGGFYHTCAVHNGAAKCWGYNGEKQLGNGGTSSSSTPVSVSGLTSGVAKVTVGYSSCALTIDGAAKCWGYNATGQLGDGTTMDRGAPVTVSGLGSGVSDLYAGTYSACAVHNGAAKCWGQNNSGQLGDGTTAPRLTPVTVSGLSSGVSRIFSGESHSCAVLSDGGSKCWGKNNSGQLGDGTTTQRPTPVKVQP